MQGPSAFTNNENALLKSLAYDCLIVAIISISVNMFVRAPAWFTRNRLIWSMLMVEYVTSFGVFFIAHLNRIELDFKG